MHETVAEVILPGFRFHPTDEELVGFYLQRKVQHRSLPIEVITQLDIYNYDPWDLPRIAICAEDVWYFFCLRDQKYRSSTRPNRVTKTGFWKSTGPDRPICNIDGSNCIGLKKSLVFYRGKAGKAVKTEWVMHEFRLPEIGSRLADLRARRQCSEDSWTVCRIFKKRSPTRRSASNSATIIDKSSMAELSTEAHSQQEEALLDSSSSEKEQSNLVTSGKSKKEGHLFNFLELNTSPQEERPTSHAFSWDLTALASQ